MKYLILLLVCQLSLAPSTDEIKLDPGKIIELSGEILDASNLEPLFFVEMKVFSGSQRLGTTLADLDGKFFLKICSNALKEDSIKISVARRNFKTEDFFFHIDGLSNLKISMQKDTSNQSSQVWEVSPYSKDFTPFYCMDIRVPDLDSTFTPTLKGKTKYEHYCTGEIKTYNELAYEGADFNDWIQIVDR